MGDNPEVTRAEFQQLVAKLDENTKVTAEVRDILATFNILFKVAKFVAAVSAAVGSVVAFWKLIKGGL